MAQFESQPIDCVVIGGGPAGLTGAIYLARFHLTVKVIDAGKSRASSIPLTRNHAGFPAGISGEALLSRMSEQARQYGATITLGTVNALQKNEGEQVFVASGPDGLEVVARSVLLATGVVNVSPNIPADIHDAALSQGLLRYCPICDGYEVTDKRIAVFGGGERGAKEALFLRSYSSDVTLLVPERSSMPEPATLARMHRGGIAIVPCPDQAIGFEEQSVVIHTNGVLYFDTLYPALGSHIQSALARDLGAASTKEGCLEVDAHQRTSVRGIYAAGDVVLGLDQISHAMGEGGVAATTIRNDLDADAPKWR